jgi:hypothetical protein
MSTGSRGRTIDWQTQFHEFLVSVLEGGEWFSSNTSFFICKKRAPGTQYVTEWWDSDAVKKGIASWLYCESNPDFSNAQILAQTIYRLSYGRARPISVTRSYFEPYNQ